MATLPAELLTAAPRSEGPRFSLVTGGGVPSASSARYGDWQGVRWPLVGAIAGGHVALGALLLLTGTVHLPKFDKPVVVKMIDTPVPQVEQPAPPVELQDVPVAVLVPEVLVEAPRAVPSPIVVITQPPPVVHVAAAPAPAAVTGPPVAAPVTPPDFLADQLDNPAPKIPFQSRRNHEQGTTTLKVLVSPEGTAQTLSVSRSSGFGRLDDAAMSTVAKWRFLPAKQAGRAIAAWVLVPVTFALA